MKMDNETMQQKSSLTYLAGLFVFAGVLITMENFSIIHGVSKHWPSLLLLLGMGLLLLFHRRRNLDPVLLWMGSFFMTLGVFFYYLNFTAWSQLSTLWPGFLGVAGISFLTVAGVKRSPLYAAFASAFLGLFVIMGLIFSVSVRLWPISFVVFGLSLLILEQLLQKQRRQE